MSSDIEYSLLKENVKRAKDYIKDKIQKSFKYDYGIDTSNPSDRLFTETVIELQIIDAILDGKTDIQALEGSDS